MVSAGRHVMATKNWRDDVELDEAWRRGFAWVEETLGGRLVSVERQERWRPSWFLDLEREGEVVPLYFRGDRGLTDHGVYPLEHEMRVFELLERHGLIVPHVHGFCPEPRGIVLDRKPGRPDVGTAETTAEQESILDHYIDQLTAIHGIPAQDCVSETMTMPDTVEEIALGDLPHYERTFREAKSGPEPLIEFILGWVRRNVPTHREKVSLLHGDSGQLIFEDGRVTALLDFELAYLGDPLADLAAMRVRDLFEPLGALPRAFRRYALARGEDLDEAAIHYHTARFALYTPMSVAALLAAPPAGVDWCLYKEWSVLVGRVSLESIAAAIGLDVPAIEPPRPRPSQRASAYETLVGLLGGEERAEVYEQDVPLRMARYLREVDRIGAELDAADLDEAAAILGKRPSDPESAEAALERVVLEAGPDRDVELLTFFLRRSRRAECLLAHSLRRLQRSTLQPLA